MRTKLLITAMGLLSFLFGSCSRREPPQPPARSPPEITAGSEGEGMVDLGFAIRSHERLPDGSRALHAHGVHHGREVGIIVVLGAEWKAGSFGPNVPLVPYYGTVMYRSLGAPSDALIQVLDQLFETKLQPANIRGETTFKGISLEGEPADLGKGPVKIKLFFESDAEDRYAELYTNVDLANGVLEISEKDDSYRSAIIKALRPD